MANDIVRDIKSLLNFDYRKRQSIENILDNLKILQDEIKIKNKKEKKI